MRYEDEVKILMEMLERINKIQELQYNIFVNINKIRHEINLMAERIRQESYNAFEEDIGGMNDFGKR